MKSKRTELDVDFIGGEEPLTKEEAKAISAYIAERKLKRKKMDNSEKNKVALKVK